MPRGINCGASLYLKILKIFSTQPLTVLTTYVIFRIEQMRLVVLYNRLLHQGFACSQGGAFYEYQQIYPKVYGSGSEL